MRPLFGVGGSKVYEAGRNRELSLEQWFEALDSGLAAGRRWWQFKPFHHRRLYWRETRPDLCAALDALSEAQLDVFERDPAAAAAWLAPWVEGGARLLELSRLPRLEPRELFPPARLEVGVPGRKWQQILAFAACLPESKAPVLEWCAGKGHLGRLLARCGNRPVTSLEWRQSLCRDGEALAARCGADMQFAHCDAFSAEAGDRVAPGVHAVALHACGDLHTTLMRHWARNGGRSLSLSPCCYHLLRGDDFMPLSSAAGRARLILRKDDLHLPLQETVTAGRGVRRNRRRELHWRLAFDELQRELRGTDSYLPVPNIQKSLLAGSFGDFARWAAERKGLALPGKLDEEEWLERGRGRLHGLRRMEMVTHLFRRPLEIWLVLDRALYLQERGAEVRLGEFCDRRLTPRNILLQAER